MSGRVHSVSKLLRLTPEESRILSKKAEECHMDESAYMRALIGGTPVDASEFTKALKDLINEVNKIGTNINQIVHNNNSELYSEIDKQHLIAYMRKLIESVDKVVEKWQ